MKRGGRILRADSQRLAVDLPVELREVRAVGVVGGDGLVVEHSLDGMITHADDAGVDIVVVKRRRVNGAGIGVGGFAVEVLEAGGRAFPSAQDKRRELAIDREY